jgi:predicted metal-dependent enzyme (double-stranded beta helix superfamily)
MAERPAGAVRECAGRLLEILDDVGDDVLRREKDIVAVMEDLLALPGLDTVVASPVWTPDAGTAGGPTVGWIYQDTDLRIVRGTITAGFEQIPHDHGTWNLFGVYRGAVHYRSYRRTDDGARPFHADLEVVEDRVMTDGDVTVLPAPPGDVHAVVGLAALSTTLLVARGAFAAQRHRYLVDRGTYYLVPSEEAGR